MCLLVYRQHSIAEEILKMSSQNVKPIIATMLPLLFQISPLTKNEAGTYECHAANAKGEVSAAGTIHVVDSIDDIPVKKGTEAPRCHCGV